MKTVALAGNPNCGKTTIFNALTGSRHHVGNWAGVTVERLSGTFEHGGISFEVVDLPGTYSLSGTGGEDEHIAATFIAESAPDLVVNVLDASNLERNLFLTTQLLELGKPVVFVLNMMDDAEKLGLRIDLPALQRLLGGPVVPTVGNREEGMEALKAAIAAALQEDPAARHPVGVNFGPDLDGELAHIARELERDEELVARHPARSLATLLLEGAPRAQQLVQESHARQAITRQVAASLAFLEPHLGADGATLVAERRYGFAHGLVAEVVQRRGAGRFAATTRLDAVLTHRVFGIPIFLAIMTAVYSLTFLLGKLPQDGIAAGFGRLRGLAAATLPAGELSGMLVDGIIPGVGAVVVFVPVIMLLMGCIAFLEDTGYMARAAFIMDRLMHLMGLHGKSFIPLVMGTGCNVPAVQATRTIEHRADRFITILVSPLVSCSARLQVYIVIAGAFFPPLQAALAILAMHVLGFALAMVVGKLLRLSFFRGDNTPFVMELPPYRMPVLRSTLVHMWEKGRVFLTRAGTTIFAGATLVWFLSHYPGIARSDWRAELEQRRAQVLANTLPGAERQARLEALALAHQSRVVNSSFAARFGKLLQPALAPILDPGRNRPEAWKDGIALTAGFVAKEIVVSTMAVVHQAPEAVPGEGQARSPLQSALRESSGLTPLTALAFMVFTLIYTPCLGTVSMILKETRSWTWTGFSIAYSLALGWVVAWGTVALGRALGFA